MTEIFSAQNLQDPIVIGIANVVLMEIGKRLPQIPLDPANPNQLRFVSGCLILATSLLFMAVKGDLNLGDVQGSFGELAQMWVMGWIVSHTAYNAVPYIKPETDSQDPEPESK